MPAGLRRLHDTGHSHFITFSCFGRRPYLSTPETRDLVVDGLARTQKKYELTVYGFCVMPEHVHVLLSEPPVGTLAQAIKSWKLSVALRQKQRPFWEQRYYDFNVFTRRSESRSFVILTAIRSPVDWLSVRKAGAGPVSITTPLDRIAELRLSRSGQSS